MRVGLPRCNVEYKGDNDAWDTSEGRGCVRDVGRCSERVEMKAPNSGLVLIFKGTSCIIEVNINLWFIMLWVYILSQEPGESMTTHDLALNGVLR